MRVIVDDLDYTEEQLLKMKKAEAIQGLSEKAQKFCEFYVEGHNRKIALNKAGFSESVTNFGGTYAYKLLRDPRIKRYIMWLKARILNANMVRAVDIVDEWVRIAFSDISDFVNIRPNSISLKPATEIDGQLIKTIRSNRDGVTIELHDKMKALDSLAKYCSDMPSDWKQRLEERKMELMEKEFELKKKQLELDNPQDEQDGFLEAIKQSANIIWEEEE